MNLNGCTLSLIIIPKLESLKITATKRAAHASKKKAYANIVPYCLFHSFLDLIFFLRLIGIDLYDFNIKCAPIKPCLNITIYTASICLSPTAHISVPARPKALQPPPQARSVFDNPPRFQGLTSSFGRWKDPLPGGQSPFLSSLCLLTAANCSARCRFER